MSNDASDSRATMMAQLQEIAHNLSWTWRHEAASLFARMSPKLWERSRNNPARVLAEIEETRLAELAADSVFVGQVADQSKALRDLLNSPSWYDKRELRPGQSPADWPAPADGLGRPFKIAYFCAEFGLAACLPIYSGGLGLLAGDHLKSAAGLGLPLVAVGLLYSHGYFQQQLDSDGRQVEVYPPIEPGRLPLTRCVEPGTGRDHRVSIELPGRRVEAAIWRCDIGGVRLYLLDTDLTGNEPRDREITRSLYLGDHDMRIRQEIVLGIGGVRALAAIGEHPTVFHMNEGHSAFLALERIRRTRETGSRLSSGGALTFDQAREAVAAGNVFTTHTPVPAGIDRFSPSLVAGYMAGYHQSLGLDMEGLLALGRENVADRGEAFSMAVLAIRTSRWCNGVSRLHGRVSRGMWRDIWPGVPVEDIPIGHVTNGVHAAGWVGERVAEALDASAGRSWRDHQDDPGAWSRVGEMPLATVWRMRDESRQSLVQWVRRRQVERAQSRGEDEASRAKAATLLHPGVLTIGFARRFAQYKRGTLLMRDPARLERLVRAERGIQILIAGKAHPGDQGGKELLRSIVQFARDRRLEDRIVVLEDYNIDVARHLVSGCDIWLNTPIRGLEASGTSGMKAVMNGAIHVSTLDGWWDEGYASDVGFSIESVGTFDHDLPNQHREDFESDALYRLLEHQIVPEFYERTPDGVPTRWAERVRRSIQSLSPRFSTHRMVKEYALKYYFPAHNAAVRLEADSFAGSRALADHIDRFRRSFGRVRVINASSEPARGGAIIEVTAVVELGGLRADEVVVQLRRGLRDQSGELMQVEVFPMDHDKDLHDGGHRYRARFSPVRSPREAWMVRVLPHDRSLVNPFIPGLIVSGSINRLDAHTGQNA